VAYWIKINYERNEYVIDLDRISAFACASNGRITFWLPDSSIPIIITQQGNPEDYHQLSEYVEKATRYSIKSSWIKLFYDRCEYLIDLDRISTFSHAANGKLTFWLPGSSIEIIITKHGDADGYHRILDYIKQKTGHSL
jgi:hypothetical protein